MSYRLFAAPTSRCSQFSYGEEAEQVFTTSAITSFLVARKEDFRSTKKATSIAQANKKFLAYKVKAVYWLIAEFKNDVIFVDWL